MTLCPPSVALGASLSVGQGQLGQAFACTPPWASDPPQPSPSWGATAQVTQLA